MFLASSADGVSSPPWKLTTPRRSAPRPASSRTVVPPKQYPIAASRDGSTMGCLASTSSPACGPRPHQPRGPPCRCPPGRRPPSQSFAPDPFPVHVERRTPRTRAAQAVRPSAGHTGCAPSTRGPPGSPGRFPFTESSYAMYPSRTTSPCRYSTTSVRTSALETDTIVKTAITATNRPPSFSSPSFRRPPTPGGASRRP